MQTLILHIETATEICSVALSNRNELIGSLNSDRPMSHASKLTVLIEQLLTKSDRSSQDLDAISVSNGPGSYTGLRIGSSTAKGMAYALDIPVVTIDSLEALALGSKTLLEMDQNDPQKTIYIPMIDARRMEVYTAIYDSNLNALEKPHARIIDEQSFSKWIEEGYSIVLSGNGAEKCRTVLTASCFTYTGLYNDAKNLVPLAWRSMKAEQFSDLAYFQPSYIKPPNITTSKKKL